MLASLKFVVCLVWVVDCFPVFKEQRLDRRFDAGRKFCFERKALWLFTYFDL